MKEFSKNDFSKELKRIRLRLSCSQAEFCKRLNISSGTYSAWETGRFLPSVSSFESVCNKLKEMRVPDVGIRSLKNKYYDLKVTDK